MNVFSLTFQSVEEPGLLTRNHLCGVDNKRQGQISHRGFWQEGFHWPS